MLLWTIVIIPLVAAIILTKLSDSPQPAANMYQNNSCVNIGAECYFLEKAYTNEDRIRGLSGRESLVENSGMLFVFDYAEIQCMWMKDMKISNDIIWIDESKKVIKVEQNVRPETYPNSFCSDIPARYVIELNAGQVQKNQLTVGQQINL